VFLTLAHGKLTAGDPEIGDKSREGVSIDIVNNGVKLSHRGGTT